MNNVSDLASMIHIYVKMSHMISHIVNNRAAMSHCNKQKQCAMVCNTNHTIFILEMHAPSCDKAISQMLLICNFHDEHVLKSK